MADVQHRIKTGDNPPVRQPPRCVPLGVRPQLAKMVNEMLRAHVIEESSSPWASPMVLVRKKNGDLRFCVYYRQLNAVTSKDVFPLPRIDDILDQLSGKSVFSTLDAQTGYWEIEMHESSREKTAFVTMDSLYEFRVMPFGLCKLTTSYIPLPTQVGHSQSTRGNMALRTWKVLVWFGPQNISEHTCLGTTAPCSPTTHP